MLSQADLEIHKTMYNIMSVYCKYDLLHLLPTWEASYGIGINMMIHSFPDVQEFLNLQIK